MNTAEKIESILNRFDLNIFVKSCKGMTMQQFDEFTIKTSSGFQKEICSFKPEENAILEKYTDKLSQIRVFYGKALNYIKTKDVKLALREGEKKLLEELYDSIKRNV